MILWDDNKVNSFKNILSAKTRQLSNIVDGIISTDLELNKRINTLAEVLYDTTFTVFGSTKYSRPSMARTLMARLPRLFRTRS